MTSRQYEPAFPVADTIGWIDFETRSKLDLKETGAYRYAVEADAIVMAYAIGTGPATTVSVGAFGAPLHWDTMPREIHAHHARVLAGKAIWAAWNAGFDKAIWNYATIGFPLLRAEHIIDVMAQATAGGLAPDLSLAAKQAKAPHKVESGRKLIKLFCENGTATPASHPVEWNQFLTYAAGDIEAMRGVFESTMQLTLREWREYWAMEAVNERGVYIDERMVHNAAELAAEDKIRSKKEITELTRGEVTSVDQVARLQLWLRQHMPPEGERVLVDRAEEVDEEGVVTRPAKYALTRRRIERLIPLMQEVVADTSRPASKLDEYRRSLRLLQLRLYGGSKTPAKFSKMTRQHLDGVLYGQYVFNGAPQTGRASSRGVQIHNLARDTLPYEHEAIEAVLYRVRYDDLAFMGDDSPVSRKLSLLIRPAFVPGGDRVFVWSDWSQIEARVLPWLCGPDSPGAVERLHIFAAVDADPSVPDIYTRTAAKLSHIPIEEVTKPIRQRGKVAELALGFMGGVGALQAMGAGYGLHIPDDEARIIVDRWREENAWAVDFSRALWDGAMLATRPQPTATGEWKHLPVQVGRVVIYFMAKLFGGTLVIQLPSGRFLHYRNFHWEDVPVLDEDDQPTGEFKKEMMFSRGYGRMKIWPGIFVENVTQATAADFLRGTLVRLEEQAFMTRLHTHDEILVECAEANAKHVAERLGRIMRQGFDWSEGLPLMSEESAFYYYTKREDTGL